MNADEIEKMVSIGDLEVPEWQFQIYEVESKKFLQLLKDETASCRQSPVSKHLIRAIHTLSGTTNTMGVDLVAKIAQPLEYWLTHLNDSQPDTVLTQEECSLLESTTEAICSMVEAIQNYKYPIFTYEHLQLQLTTLMDSALASQNDQIDSQSSNEADLSELLSFDDDVFGDIDNLLGEMDLSENRNDSLVAIALPTATSYEQSSATHENRLSSDFSPILASFLPDDTLVDDVDASIKDIFLEEAVDIFDSLPKIIEKWMASPNDDGENVNLIKRAFHTLKGSARMAGYLRFGHVVHHIESVMDDGFPGLHQNDLPEIVQLTCDAMAQEIEHLQNHQNASGFYRLRSYHHAHKNTVHAAPEILHVSSVSAPRVKQNNQDLPSGYKDLMSEKDVNADEETVTDTLRVPTAKVDGLASHLGKNGMIQLRIEASVTSVELQISEMAINLERLRRLLKDVEIQAETQMKSRVSDAQKEGIAFDPLEFDRFSRLQELTRMTAEAMNDINNSQTEIVRGLTDIQDSVAETSIIADDMQHSVMSVRTVPVNSIRRRLERLVRQACQDTNKQANLIVENEIDIDSGVLSKVTAPLEHLLRNAIAHGIESPPVRISSGKKEIGALTLGVVMRGNDIIFRMSDDGAGINREAVERKARQNGMIGPDDSITQERANMLIFDPGFSTVDTVSALAGRGVGMDVVQGEIAAIGGRINVHSVAGHGTVFELIVPSYMSVISMVPVLSNKITYAVPATLVEDVVVVRDHIVLSAYESGYLEHNNQNIPFYGLSEVAGQGRNEITRNNRVLLITDKDDQKTVAVHIDALEPDRNLVMKPLCRTIATLPGLMGSTVSGDGTPLLVINPVFLKNSVQRIDTSKNKNTTVNTSVRTKADITVMVVDDSLTVRRITERFLQREGFKSIVAKDGLDAIEKVAEFGCPDIFLCDIEMPNMDGFQFVEHIRTAVSKTVPIIMISSRSIEKYESHARMLGVNKSIGKPYQEPDLLSAIEELTGLTTK